MTKSTQRSMCQAKTLIGLSSVQSDQNFRLEHKKTMHSAFFLICTSQSTFFSDVSEWVSLGYASPKQRIKWLAHGHNTVTPLAVRLELATLPSPV